MDTSTSNNNNPHCWIPSVDGKSPNDNAENINCLCLGTGRFLRSVLVPALTSINEMKPVLIQTRGRTFLEYMKNKEATSDDSSNNNTYEIDTVLSSSVNDNDNNNIQTDSIPCYGAYSLGNENDKKMCYDMINKKIIKPILIFGVGVTEAGLSTHKTQVMKDLYDIINLFRMLTNNGKWKFSQQQKICIIDMDNVPNNGNVIKKHMETLAEKAETETETKNDNKMSMKEFLNKHISFLNTMVDRITSHRPDNKMIPRCEPIPKKALVILDEHNDLPLLFTETFSNNSNSNKYGIFIRSTKKQLNSDIELKLRIANGTHTSIAHCMALMKLCKTDSLSNNESLGPLLMKYIDSLFYKQILVGAMNNNKELGNGNRKEIIDVYDDWRNRLIHPFFGLSTFFITQNGPAKGGIRLSPTIIDLLLKKKSSSHNDGDDDDSTVTCSMAFAYAALLRWLTPCCSSSSTTTNNENIVFTGWLDDDNDKDNASSSSIPSIVNKDESSTSIIEYADGLRYDLKNSWYEFRCTCQVPTDNGEKEKGNNDTRNLSDWLYALTKPSPSSNSTTNPKQPQHYIQVIKSYLISNQGGNLECLLQQEADQQRKALTDFTLAIATLYARMVAGDTMIDILQEMNNCIEPYKDGFDTSVTFLLDNGDTNTNVGGFSPVKKHKPLHYKPHAIPSSSRLMEGRLNTNTVMSVVASEVQSAIAIDLHTHLLPPTHGTLCLWGIDELLTYHYLVAEYFMTAPASMTPEIFYALSKKEQADLIWQALFLDRTPISEACRGVITTLIALGLQEAVNDRNLSAIREYYRQYRDDGEQGSANFCEKIFALSGIRYAVMTNIPFDSLEVRYWRPQRKEYSSRFRSALRVDPLLAGDRRTIENALKASGYPVTLEGARQYLRDWCDTMNPEYMMASTPHDFVLREGTLSSIQGKDKTGVNEEALKQPFAFVHETNMNAVDCNVDCDGAEDEVPSVIDENSDFLSEVLMTVCEELDLPVALKIGAHRGVNPKLRAAGDGLVAFADAGVLGRLCTRFPKVRFLATFLSKNNQHEACVLASKFRNLHIYGCWWFCNNPSIITEISKMRIEMLGSAFTAQHSDARVVDQLIYKWPHNRRVLAEVLGEEYQKLIESGWAPKREEVRRDVERLFGGSYEEFMSKSLLDCA